MGIFILLQIMAGISLKQFLLNFLYLVIFLFFTKLSYISRMMSICNPEFLIAPRHHQVYFKPHHTHHIIYSMSALSLRFLCLLLSLPCHHVLVILLTFLCLLLSLPCHHVLVSPLSSLNSSCHQWQLLPTYIVIFSNNLPFWHWWQHLTFSPFDSNVKG